MPKFSFTITVPVTMSAQVEVDAESIEEAHEIALTKSFYRDPQNAEFHLDDDNELSDAYIPDEDDYEILDESADEEPQGPRL